MGKTEGTVLGLIFAFAIFCAGALTYKHATKPEGLIVPHENSQYIKYIDIRSDDITLTYPEPKPCPHCGIMLEWWESNHMVTFKIGGHGSYDTCYTQIYLAVAEATDGKWQE